MGYDLDVFSVQLPIAKLFLYHLIYHRVISAAYKRNRMQDEFWTLTSDAHLLHANINWCMVFGADFNTTHWKRLLLGHSRKHEQTFRDGLLLAIEMSADKWLRYWTSMKEFRDKYAAHRELGFAKPVPDFDTAFKVVLYYDQWVRIVISPDTIAEPSLYSFAQSLQKTAVPFIEKLMSAPK